MNKNKRDSVREVRFSQARELRIDDSDGKEYLTGYAARYNVLSENLGGFVERIMPGAFTRSLKEKQDIRHLINHDPNLVLGRTASGTTQLSEDDKGLSFRTLLPNTSYAKDLAELVRRGDLNECSFGMIVKDQRWLDKDGETTVREVLDVDTFDISSVTFPAYPQTNTALAARALFPDGMPAEIRSHVREVRNAGVCLCECAECQSGACQDCSDPDCKDENCRCDDDMRSVKPITKLVDGEELTADCFLIVADASNTKRWSMPYKFSTDEKTKLHLRNALNRFQEAKGSEADKDAAWSEIVKQCRQHGIVADETLAKRLTAQQIADLQPQQEIEVPDEATRAMAIVRAIQASL